MNRAFAFAIGFCYFGGVLIFFFRIIFQRFHPLARDVKEIRHFSSVDPATVWQYYSIIQSSCALPVVRSRSQTPGVCVCVCVRETVSVHI